MHKVNTTQKLEINQKVTLQIDKKRREKIKANHTLAHLLQAALKNTLGDHVHQAGSYVSDQYMRFDFTHFQKVEPTQLKTIEDWMNVQIFKQIPLTTSIMDLEQAKLSGATALFSEKYESQVRVVSVGSISMELCGGTHVSNTSEIAIAKIISEESIGSGIRRILCKSKMEAYKEYKHAITQLETIAAILNTPSISNIEEKVDQLKNNYQTQTHEVAQLQDKITQQQALALAVGAKVVDGVSIVIKKIENQASKNLKSMVEASLRQIDQGIIFLGAMDDDKVLFVCGCTKELLVKNVDCSALVKMAAQMTGGNGGGRKDLAQAGGKDLTKVDEAMAAVTNKIREML
jgi:alanyl-tRNA synthetase